MRHECVIAGDSSGQFCAIVHRKDDAVPVLIDIHERCQRIKHVLSSKLSKEDVEKRVRFHQGNILDLPFLEGLFKSYKESNEPIDGIMHFAAKKAIGESFQKPMMYYENNVVGSMNLFKMMEQFKECKSFIFSSTAGVYGDLDNCK